MSTDSDQQTEARLTELEIKVAFTEELLERLDAVIIEQQRRMDLLVQELVRLREQVQRTDAPSGPQGDERPPHY